MSSQESDKGGNPSMEKRLRCEYLMKNNRSCLKVAAGEGQKDRKKFCSDISKDLCCRVCDSRKQCQISCAEVARLETEEREAVEHTRYLIAADVHIGDEGISVNCPHCSSPERLDSKTSEVICKHCGKKYLVPEKILDLI